VDPIAVRDLQNLISSLQDRNIAVLITDHSVRETLRICHRASILADGRVVITGTPQEIASNEQARAVYLGDDFVLHDSATSAPSPRSSAET